MIHPDLKPLLAVQELDDSVRVAEAAMREVEPEMRVFDDELAAAQRAGDNARLAVEEAKRRRDELETKIENYRVLQERKEERLEFVRGPKEASALMAEIDLTKNVMAQEEAEWLRSSGSVTDAERRVKEAEEQLDAVREAQAPKRVELGARVAELEQGLNAAKRTRDSAAEGVKGNVLERYRKITSSRGRGVVALHGVACGGCFTNIPIQRRSLIERGSVIEVCEACGVLLYVPDASE